MYRKVNLKFLFIGFGLVVTSLNISADEDKEKIIAQSKEHFLKNLDQKIEVLQQAKICGAKANSREELKICRKQLFNSSEIAREEDKKKRQEVKSELKNLKKDKLEKKLDNLNKSINSEPTPTN